MHGINKSPADSIVIKAQPKERSATQSRFLIAVCWLAAFLPMLDTSIVNLALPQLAGAFRLAPNDLGWVTNAYLLPLVVAIPAVGRIGDAMNRAHALVAGAAIFAVASFGAAMTSSWPVLLAMRALQGLGASALATMSMAIVSASFAPGRKRDAALGWYLSGPAVGGALGPIAGAALTAMGGWRMMFVGQVPFALAVALAGLWLSSPSSGVRRSLDPVGLALSAIVLFCLSAGLLEAPVWGWTSPWIVGAWLVAVTGSIAFFVHERRVAQPLISPHVFASRIFLASGLAGAAVWFGVISGFMLLPLYFQDARGFDALRASLLLGSWPIGALVMYPFVGKTVARSGPAVAMKAALIISLATAIAMIFYGAGTPDVLIVAVGFVLGIATAVGQVSTAVGAVSGFANQDAGIAAGVFNTVRQVGSIVGGALPVSMLAIQGGGKAGVTYEGLHVAFASRALLLGVCLTFVFLLLRPRRSDRTWDDKDGRGQRA